MKETDDLRILEKSIDELIEKLKSLGVKEQSDSLKLELIKIFSAN